MSEWAWAWSSVLSVSLSRQRSKRGAKAERRRHTQAYARTQALNELGACLRARVGPLRRGRKERKKERKKEQGMKMKVTAMLLPLPPPPPPLRTRVHTQRIATIPCTVVHTDYSPLNIYQAYCTQYMPLALLLLLFLLSRNREKERKKKLKVLFLLLLFFLLLLLRRSNRSCPTVRGSLSHFLYQRYIYTHTHIQKSIQSIYPTA